MSVAPEQEGGTIPAPPAANPATTTSSETSEHRGALATGSGTVGPFSGPALALEALRESLENRSVLLHEARLDLSRTHERAALFNALLAGTTLAAAGVSSAISFAALPTWTVAIATIVLAIITGALIFSTVTSYFARRNADLIDKELEELREGVNIEFLVHEAKNLDESSLQDLAVRLRDVSSDDGMTKSRGRRRAR